MEIVQIGGGPSEVDFSFQVVPPSSEIFPAFLSQDKAPLFAKWGLGSSMQVLRFSFDQVFKRGMATELVLSLLNSDEFRSVFELVASNGKRYPWQSNARVRSVQMHSVPCTLTSLDAFDVLKDNVIVRKAVRHEDDENSQPIQSICKMQDIFLHDGLTISDRLRCIMLLNTEELENECTATYNEPLLELDGNNSNCDDVEDEPDTTAPLFHKFFPASTRREFLVLMLRHIVSGGAMNQYEDDFTVYEEIVRDCYKNLVCVTRDPAEGSLQLDTMVYQVHAISTSKTVEGAEKNELVDLFPVESDESPIAAVGNFFYVVVNPSRRELNVWYNAFWNSF